MVADEGIITTSALRVLGPADLPALQEMLDRDPVRHCFVASRLHASGMLGWRLGGEMWGWYEGEQLVSACYNGANLVPVQANAAALFAFADRARRFGRRCSSMVGPADEITELWRLLAPAWGPAREERMNQPLMTLADDPQIAPDPSVRPVREDEIDLLLPASVAMFTEEVGIPPSAGESIHIYRGRVAELVRAGRALARIENGEVLFKAEIGASSPQACQVQGVWVDPRHRGSGLAAPGMAAVVQYARAKVSPIVSLYVNDYNTAARRAYRSVGFAEVDTFASVLF